MSRLKVMVVKGEGRRRAFGSTEILRGNSLGGVVEAVVTGTSLCVVLTCGWRDEA